MKFTLHQDQMRVTSIPYSSTKMVIFSGVPLKKNSHKTHSGKYYVTIKADPDAIPVQPALGQHWSVKGHRLIEEMETGDYVMQQHTYESPEHIECSLPGVVSENGIYGHSRFCNTDFDDKLACLNLSGV